MNDTPINVVSKKAIQDSFASIEDYLKADVLVYYGEFLEGVENQVKRLVEDLVQSRSNGHRALYVVLTTTGGSLNPVKRIVDVLRHHYDEVCFIIPDYAYSAGTILCASGDRIYMSYFSALGPIDPQIVTKDNKIVSALGYLDKIQEMLEKAKNGTLTEVEFLILKDFDLAELRAYEQAKELAVDLLKTWLPKYKFKTWVKHKDGTDVTDEERVATAEEIAKELGSNNRWKSHGRSINMDELQELGLKIDDLQADDMLYKIVSEYHDMMLDYARKYDFRLFMQTRGFI